MANTSVIYTHIDIELKKEAENMLYSQIVLTRSLPLKLQLPTIKPTSIGAMNKDEIDNEIMKGIHSLTSDKTYTIDEVDAELKQDFSI